MRTPRVRRRKNRPIGSIQNTIVDGFRGRPLAVVETDVTVLMVATELCGEPLLRVMLDGSKEQVAY
jgi:hypothetical protein